jgi:hypothetical protein
VVEHAGATQIALALLAHPGVQVARASAAMLHLALGRAAKTLLNAFVSLDLGHAASSRCLEILNHLELASVPEPRQVRKGRKMVGQTPSRLRIRLKQLPAAALEIV